MKRKIFSYILSLLFLSSCITEDVPDNSPRGNFEALWRIIDTKYCFLDYKHEEYGLDWDEVYQRYHHRLTDDMTNKQLFQVLAEMLEELRDGHVNLVATHETSQYRAWYDKYPTNFVDTIQRIYLGKDYKTVAGIKYQILEDNIGYIYYGSFSAGIGESNLDEVLNELSICDGLILDIRNNGGVYTLIARLVVCSGSGVIDNFSSECLCDISNFSADISQSDNSPCFPADQVEVLGKVSK